MTDATEHYIQMIDADNRLLYHRLRESTALLRLALPPDGTDTTRLYGPVEKQIAANEAALKRTTEGTP